MPSSYTPAPTLLPLPRRTFIRVINVKDPRPNLTSLPLSLSPFLLFFPRARVSADPKGFHRRRRAPHSQCVGSPIGGSNVGQCIAAAAAAAAVGAAGCEINNNPADGQSGEVQ